MKSKTLAAIIVSFYITLCCVSPVSAFYFEFNYFETDKLVYEIGETINMVAQLTADFSESGWCYVSFAVVTDQGPSFSDSYYIPPSSDVRLLNSSYTILPEDTSPGVNGSQAFIIFNVEIFDSYSQGDGDTIIVNITRGSLDVTPLTPLSIEFDTNTTLDFRVVSAHNQSIVYENSPVNVTLFNSTSHQIHQTSTTTSPDGKVELNWTDSTGPPGDYTIKISGNGTNDFLPFSKSFPLSVTRAESNLTVVSAPISVHCQTSDGSQIESATVLVEQTTMEGQAIADSILQWETSFSTGSMSNLGNGFYSALIPFNTGPGTYHVNLTATNSLYRNEYESISIDAIPYTVELYSPNATFIAYRGSNVSISLSINSSLLQSQPIPIELVDQIAEIGTIVSVAANTQATVILYIDNSTTTGLHTVSVELRNESYINQASLELEILVHSSIEADVGLDSIFYGETTEIILNVTDENGQEVEFIDIMVYVDDDVSAFTISTGINTSLPIQISFPAWISPGSHILRFSITSTWCNEFNISKPVIVWMRTSITVSVGTQQGSGTISEPSIIPTQDSALIFAASSSGVIISPPPIFASETTSISSPDTLVTSRESCPRLSSGINNLSTDPAKSLTSESGNGHTVLIRRDLKGGSIEFLAMSSSTDLEVHPYEIIPHSAVSGPSTTTSVRKACAS